MKVYTYYEPIPEIENCFNRKKSQKCLIDLCFASWKRFGWEPNILREEDAAGHPLYDEYKKNISKLPSANPSFYEYHCYMRWLSMANIGGGLLIDYDVMNMGLKDSSFFNFNELTIYQGHVPCVVSGKAEHYLQVVEKFMSIDYEKYTIEVKQKQHMSDMILLSSGEINFKKFDFVSFYPNYGLLIHCNQSGCIQNKIDKYDIMLELLEKRL